jgi:hypothetical protein
MAVLYCILIAVFITAMIHSSSATIGIVMGLGAAGVLEWKTAVAFLAGRRPGDDDHVLDGVAQPVVRYKAKCRAVATPGR